MARLDPADPASVASRRGWNEPLHILVNNAGVMALPTAHPDLPLANGNAVRHKPSRPFRAGHRPASPAGRGKACPRGIRCFDRAPVLPVVFDDLHYRFRPYDQWTSYGQSRSADVLFAVGAAQRWADDGIAVNALMPGNVASTGLARHMGADDLANFGETTDLALPPAKTIEQGAATSVLLAASPDV